MKNKDEMNYIKRVLFSELNKYLFIVPNSYKHVEEDSILLNDYNYIISLHELIDDIAIRNKYPKNVIENIQKLLKHYLSLDSVKPDVKNLYHGFLEITKQINNFNYEFLDEDFNLKYSSFDTNNQISGEKYQTMMESLADDYRIMVKLTQNDFDEKIDDKNTVLAIKKFMIMYPDLFTIRDVRDKAYTTLLKVSSKVDDKYLRSESDKLIKHLAYNNNSYFDMDSFINYYERSLIIGLVTNSNFLDKFRELKEEEIMDYKFISNLLSVIKNYDYIMSEQVVSNLYNIVSYIGKNFEKHYGEDDNHVINEMKVSLNKCNGKDNLDFVNHELTYRTTTYEYLKLLLASRKEYNYQFFEKLKSSILDEQYNFSQVLKSYLADDESFEKEYFDKLVRYQDYVSCITKIDYEYPTLLLQEKAIDRTKRVIEAKLDGLLEDKKNIKTHKKVLNIIKKYYNDIY